MRLWHAGCALLCLIGAPMARAGEAEDFFIGKQLKMTVGYGPGTGNDVYARHLAKYLGRHMPGNPAILTVNMPGAASLVHVNYLYNIAPRDGTVIGMPSRNLLTEPLFHNEQAKFDGRKFTYMGSMTRETALCSTWHTSGIATIEDAMKGEVLVGSTAPNSGSSIFPKILNRLFGTRFKPVTGYPDSAAVGLAMERGEVKGYCSFPLSAIRSARPRWLDEKLINILLQLTTRPHPALAGVPMVMDLARTDAQRQMLTLVFADQEMGRPLAGPPDMPPERLAVLRKAFDETMKDPEFLAEAAALHLDVDGPIDGAAVEEVVQSLYATPQQVADEVRAIREE